jgi:hypothetical protein
MLAPKLGATLPASALSAAPAASSFAQAAPNLLGRDQILQAFSREGLGQNLTQLGPNLAGPVDPTALAFKPTVSNAPFLNTVTEGSAIQGVTSNLPQAAMGNVAGGPAIPGVTSGLPVSTTQVPLVAASTSPIEAGASFLQNFGNLIKNPSMDAAIDYAKEHPYATASAAYGLYGLMNKPKRPPTPSLGMIRPYEFQSSQRPEAYEISPLDDSSERLYFDNQFIAGTPYEAPGPEYRKASGGIASVYAGGGHVEQMAAMNSAGANTGYPMANINTPTYSNPMMQRPEAVNVISPSGDVGVGAFSGEQRFAVGGGISDLGGYSDGGRLLKGPGDGVSDSIPAVIGERQPARLADGEFVIPARIVSELGNGSTEAGARKLYAMMDRVQKSRRKTVGKDRVAANTRADKHLPA